MLDKSYEVISLIMRYWFIGLIILITYRVVKSAVRTNKSCSYREEGPFGHIVFFSVLLISSAFVLLAKINPDSFDRLTALIGLGIGLFMILQYNVLRLIFPGMDRLLLIITDVFAMLGFIMLYRFSPDTAISQIKYFALGNVALVSFMLFTYRVHVGNKMSYVLMGLGCALLLLPIFFGVETFGAKNWIIIRGYSLQPSELVKIILIFVFASQFTAKHRFSDKLPTFIFTGAAILLVVLQKDLGGALLYFYIFMFMYYIAASDWIVVSLAGIAAVAGSIISYRLFSHVRVRIEAWKNPWGDIENKGYQIAHSLIAISSGGLVGTGLGLGSPQIVPASKTDFIFTALCEEFGIIAGLCIIALYAMIAIRGATTALRSKNSYKALLAFGATVALTLQAFTIMGGVIKMIPLTGVTLPFISYGGSSMVVSMALIGVIEGVAMGIYEDQEEAMEDYGDDSPDGINVTKEYGLKNLDSNIGTDKEGS